MSGFFLSWLFPPCYLNFWSCDVGCFTLSLLLQDKGVTVFLVRSLLWDAGGCGCVLWDSARGSIAVPQVDTGVMLLLPCQDPLLFSSPFQGTSFWYTTLKKHFHSCKRGDIILWRHEEYQMVLQNVVWMGWWCENHSVVVSVVWGLLLLGSFPVYKNKEEMHKCGHPLIFCYLKCLLWQPKVLGFFSAHLKST